ncbi:unnamed protein product [Rotaria sp. Silwood1]|nr:unnamed protein product [Rotaria sp. Silwood1]
MQGLQKSLSKIEDTIRKLERSVSEAEQGRHQRQQPTSPPIQINNIQQEKQSYPPPPVRPPPQLPRIQPPPQLPRIQPPPSETISHLG